MLCGVIEQSVGVFDSFVNCLDWDYINSFCNGLEKAYCDEGVECPMALTHVPRAGATSVSCRSDSKEEGKSGPFT